MQKYLYHRKPSVVKGSIIYSLSALQKDHPDLYDKEIKKYEAREKLLNRHIPKLNCLWKDLVFTSPLNPKHIYKALQEFNLPCGSNDLWFKIPIEDVINHDIAWFKYPKREKGDFRIKDEDVELIELDKYEELNAMPKETIDYYQASANNREKPLLFHLIPHVLIRGTIDISNAEMITWKN